MLPSILIFLRQRQNSTIIMSTRYIRVLHLLIITTMIMLVNAHIITRTKIKTETNHVLGVK